MKKIILIGLLVLCSKMFSQDTEAEIIENVTGHNLFYGEFDEVLKMEDIPRYIMTKINPVQGVLFSDPQETLEKGNATYLEYLLLIMNIAKVRFETELDLLFVLSEVEGVESVPILGYNGIILNPYTLKMINGKEQVLYVFRFDEVFINIDCKSLL